MRMLAATIIALVMGLCVGLAARHVNAALMGQATAVMEQAVTR